MAEPVDKKILKGLIPANALKAENFEELAGKTFSMSKYKKYEDAARYRDQLNVVTQFTRKQKKASQDFKDRDVVVVSAENRYGVGVVMRIRNGHIMGREKFNLKVQ